MICLHVSTKIMVEDNMLTNNKTQKEKYHVRIYLEDVFGFSEHQLKTTYGLGYKLTLTRNSENAVLKKINQ